MTQNPFSIFAEADRPRHGGTDINVLKELVLNVLKSKMAKHAFERIRPGHAARVVFWAPRLLPKHMKSGEMRFNEVTHVGKAKSALVVIDVDEAGFVIVVTDYATSEAKDQGGQAGENNAFQIGDILYVEREEGKFDPQVIGGTTHKKKGEDDVRRSRNAPTKYGEG